MYNLALNSFRKNNKLIFIHKIIRKIGKGMKKKMIRILLGKVFKEKDFKGKSYRARKREIKEKLKWIK